MEKKFEFITATEKDLEEVCQLIEVTGWGETLADIKRAYYTSTDGFITLTGAAGNQLIAVTWIGSYGEIGFIGMVVVEPNSRGRGIGQAITEEAVSRLISKGCSTIKLDAVQRAVRLYKRVGFVPEMRSLRFKKDFTKEGELAAFWQKRKQIKKSFPVFTCKEDNLAQIIDADKEFFGGDRSKLLLSLFDEFPEFAFITLDTDDFLAGYLFGAYQSGTLKLRAGVSDSFETAVSLIDAAITTARAKDDFQKVVIGIPEKNLEGVRVLRYFDFEETNFSVRMYRGKKSDATVHPAIFAIGHPAKG